MQCFVEAPALGVQCRQLGPDFTVRLQEFLRVHCLHAGLSLVRGFALLGPKRAYPKARRMRRCAPPHMAIALLNTLCVQMRHAVLTAPDAMVTSGVSSNSAALISCASVLKVRALRASINSWYVFSDMRSCHGTHLMVPCGLNHWCTRDKSLM